ncbi:MAG TPA: glycosyltransferase [Nitrospiraceae bacterium]|jgi:UDP-N-acetylmuramyl pentapeptide phosphotransferase/UDP-N-acetylglucosamine-1-phosphate transferase|nr:glycosyltransferase [Nitrospiraceae bacterium]
MNEISVWLSALSAVGTSCLICAVISFCGRRFQLRGMDDPGQARRKVHVRPVPRVGGIGLVIALVVACALFPVAHRIWAWSVVALSLPAFGAGLAEDLGHRVLARTRLGWTAVTAVAAYALFPEFRVQDLDLPGTAWLFSMPGVSLLFTVVVVSGVTHSINMIDGLNGLAGITILFIASAISAVAWTVGDVQVGTMSLVVAGGTLGFLLLNYPTARVFLGDGGAYLLGFLTAELAVAVVQRNPPVSPWFACVALLYPVWETLFSIWRRRVLRHKPAMTADGLHLHHLMYKRLFRRNGRNHELHNAAAALTVAGFPLLTILAASVWWSQTPQLQLAALGFVAVYGGVYRALVLRKLRVPLRVQERGLCPPSSQSDNPFSR